MEKSLIEELKIKLEEEKKLIEKELSGFAKKDDMPKGDWETKYPNREDADKEEEADELEEYNSLLPIEQTLELKLKDIDLALEKIKNGTYGKCENCDKEIPEERLRAYPEARNCFDCEEQK